MHYETQIENKLSQLVNRSHYATPKEFTNAPITGHCGLVLEENLGQGNHLIIVTPLFSKTSFLKRFSSTRKRKACVFKFLRFEECFRKVFSKSSVFVTD